MSSDKQEVEASCDPIGRQERKVIGWILCGLRAGRTRVLLSPVPIIKSPIVSIPICSLSLLAL